MHKTGEKWEMEREAVTVNLNDNMHGRDTGDPLSPPLIAVLPWVRQNPSCPAVMNTCTVNSCPVPDFIQKYFPALQQ